MIKFNLRKKVTKLNLRITANCHEHIQILTKTPAKFKKKDSTNSKLVGGVAFTKYPVSKCAA